jgi:hypothetical protein
VEMDRLGRTSFQLSMDRLNAGFNPAFPQLFNLSCMCLALQASAPASSASGEAARKNLGGEEAVTRYD